MGEQTWDSYPTESSEDEAINKSFQDFLNQSSDNILITGDQENVKVEVKWGWGDRSDAKVVRSGSEKDSDSDSNPFFREYQPEAKENEKNAAEKSPSENRSFETKRRGKKGHKKSHSIASETHFDGNSQGTSNPGNYYSGTHASPSNFNKKHRRSQSVESTVNSVKNQNRRSSSASFATAPLSLEPPEFRRGHRRGKSADNERSNGGSRQHHHRRSFSTSDTSFDEEGKERIDKSVMGSRKAKTSSKLVPRRKNSKSSQPPPVATRERAKKTHKRAPSFTIDEEDPTYFNNSSEDQSISYQVGETENRQDKKKKKKTKPKAAVLEEETVVQQKKAVSLYDHIIPILVVLALGVSLMYLYSKDYIVVNKI